MGTQTQQAQPKVKYTYRARAVAANFVFTSGHHPNFGDAFTLELHSDTPGECSRDTGARTGPDISFTHSSVHISFKKEAGGVYTTIAKASLRNLNVKDILTVDLLESSVKTVYREEWSKPEETTYARVLPLLPVIQNLKIYGVPFRLDHELKLPEHFSYDEARRAKYFSGEGAEILPVRIANGSGRRISTAQGEIELSADTRRITVPKFGIVYIADWKPWDVTDAQTGAHWVQALGLNLTNPGTGGGSGAGGNGSGGHG
jgi:hypothetical protein